MRHNSGKQSLNQQAAISNNEEWPADVELSKLPNDCLGKTDYTARVGC